MLNYETMNECTETVKKVKLAKITLAENESENKYNSVFCIDDSSFYSFYRNYYLFCLLQLVLD